MKFQIGLHHGGGQLTFETTLDSNELIQQLETARTNNGLLDFTDTKGDRILIPADSVAYLLIPSERETKVGFGRA